MKTSSKKWQKIRKIKGLRQFVTWYPRHVSENPGVKADVIVNTANPNPICVSGTDLAIYEAAGKEKLLAERANIGKIARGDIAVTGAYNLKAKYIIHTVGPVWTDGLHHEFEILKHFMESLLC